MPRHTQEVVTYEQFCEEWLAEIRGQSMSSLEKGRHFAIKLITQWLDVTSEDEDLFVCDGSGDGGIDIAYLQRKDLDSGVRNSESAAGDTWYVVQSKYGTSFAGNDSILKDGQKIIDTLEGNSQHLSGETQRLLQRLDSFRESASDTDRIVLVFATTDPITQSNRRALQDIKAIGRGRGIVNFDVEEVSLKTIWRSLNDLEHPKLSLEIEGQFIEQQYSGLILGTVSLLDLFEFLNKYRDQAGNLDQLYDKNVRQFLGNRRKINKGIAATLQKNPEKFGLYNNGITIVVSGYSKVSSDTSIRIDDPYIVNGCQTTRTIWEVLDSKLNAGGTGTSVAIESWKNQVRRGGVLTKIIKGDDSELPNITRFTNSQNSVREQDFIALDVKYQEWAEDFEKRYNVFLEIQRGGIESRKALEKRDPRKRTFEDYVNAFDLIKIYGAGWLGEPGTAFRTNTPFLPTGSIYQRMIGRKSSETPFGPEDLYAAYIIKCAADRLVFGRRAASPSRYSSRFLFYYIAIKILDNVIRLTPELDQPNPSVSMLTKSVIQLSESSTKEELELLCRSAVAVIERYFSKGEEKSIHNEQSLSDIYNGNTNAFLKSKDLGVEEFSPLLVGLIAETNSAMSVPHPMSPRTSREYIASALIAKT